MRFVLLLTILCLILGGCNADPRYRRETALLRAELVDLEDRLFIVKSQRDAAVDALHGHGKGELADKIIRRGPVDRISHVDGHCSDPIIYEDGFFINDSAPAPIYRHQDFDSQGVYFDESYPGEIQLDDFDQSNSSRFNPSDQPNRGSRNWDQHLEETNSSTIRREFDRQPSSSSSGNRSQQGSVRNHLNPPQSVSRNQKLASESRSLDTGDAGLRNIHHDGVVAIRIDQQASFEQEDPLTGAPGIKLVIQPVDSGGRINLEPSSLEISLIDPYRASVSQRIGSWKFLAEETELFFDELENGIVLHLAYQDTFPIGDQVELAVRYRTHSGKMLQAGAKIPLAVDKRPGSEIRIDHDDDDLITGSSTKQRGAVGNNEIDRPTWRPIR